MIGDAAADNDEVAEGTEDTILIHIPESEKGTDGDKAFFFVESVWPKTDHGPNSF